MKKLQFWMLFAILFSNLAVTSCNDSDDDSPAIPKHEYPFFTNDINALIDANYEELKTKSYAELVIPATLYDKSKFSLNSIPTNAKADMERLLAAGYRAYINGGSVRDAIMGVPSHDIDFSTDATADQIMVVFPEGIKLHAFGNYYVVKVPHEGEEPTDMGPMMSIWGYDKSLQGKGGIPMSQFQGETYCNDLMEDSYTRDFTMNCLYYDCKTGDIIDYHGGLHDIREGIINTIFDSELKLSTDPRAILRALRFKAKYEFTFADRMEKAMRNSQLTNWLATLNNYNVIYNMQSGFEGGFSKRFFQELQDYKVTDAFLKSMSARLHTEAYSNEVETILGFLDEKGKADMAVAWAAIFWPQAAEELKGKASPTIDDVAAVWRKIDSANSANFKFDVKDSTFDDTYVPEFIQALWYLQYQLGNASNQTAEKTAELKKAAHIKDALLLFQARASYDSSLKSAAGYWLNQL